MRQRCYNPNSAKYPSYGGVGVRACKRWDVFANFLADMGERPPGKSLDRIDNNRGYSKSNCRWATSKEQCRNRGNTLRVLYEGHSIALAELAERSGIPYFTLHSRIERGTCPIEDLLRPVGSFAGRSKCR